MPKKSKEIYLFSVRGVLSMAKAILLRGISLFTILETRTKLNPDKLALIYEENRYTYLDIYERTIGLMEVLKQKYNLKSGQKAAIICSNSPQQIFAIFALAAIGIDIYLLNVEMSKDLFSKITERHKFDFIIYDPPIFQYIRSTQYEDKSLSTADTSQFKFIFNKSL